MECHKTRQLRAAKANLRHGGTRPRWPRHIQNGRLRAVTLFTEEAVRQTRAQTFSQEVLDDCQSASSFASNTIPKVISAISQVTGIELIASWKYNIAHTKISVSDDTETVQFTVSPQYGGEDTVQDEELPAFGWHYDSVPFVCITMLSDCTDMVGSETAIRTGNGADMKGRARP